MRKCQAKQEHDKLIKIEKENEMLRQVLQEKTDENKQLKLELREANSRPTVINNNTNNGIIHNKSYYIIQNFTDAHNLSDLLTDDLDDEQIMEIFGKGYVDGGVEYVYNQCVADIPLNKRPLHTVDKARGKIMCHDNDVWKDYTIELLMKHKIDPVMDTIIGTGYQLAEDEREPENHQKQTVNVFTALAFLKSDEKRKFGRKLLGYTSFDSNSPEEEAE